MLKIILNIKKPLYHQVSFYCIYYVYNICIRKQNSTQQIILEIFIIRLRCTYIHSQVELEQPSQTHWI